MTAMECQKSETDQPPSPTPHVCSLAPFAKHGGAELHSRLKTRKLLGVGETNDGDVHRSKLSQILGHNEQLYHKEPKGLRFWQLLMSILFSCLAILEFLNSGYLLSRSARTDYERKRREDQDVEILTARLYGAALLSLSVLFWKSFLSSDRVLMRASLLTSLCYSLLHVIVSVVTVWFSSSSFEFLHYFCLQSILGAIFAGVSFHFYRSTNR